MTVSWVGENWATIPPAVRNRAGSGAGRSELRSAGAVHAMRSVLPGAPTCEVERGAVPVNTRDTTACASVSPGARVPAAVGVQVVAGSNPVAPTIEARSNVRKIGEAAGFASPVPVSRPTGAPWAGSEPDSDGDDDGEPPSRAAGRPLPSSVPSFLEACARLASEAAARGDFVRARELIEKAARVAQLREVAS